jgi:hypothetical protein
MESRNILSATSLFCSQRNWPVLLRSIQNFNKTIYKKPSFSLEFNYLSGENIRLSFLAQENRAERLLKHTDEYFKNFFCKLKPDSRKQSGEIFKSFEQNNIYYGLYEPILIKKGEIKNYTLQFTLSKLIIAALKDEDHLDDETILTLAFYFIITVIKVIEEKFDLNKKILTGYFKERFQQLETFENTIIKAKYKENKSILLEIYNSIGGQEAPQWIKRWENFLLDFMNNNNTETKSKAILIFGQIRKQLGLNNIKESMLCYFIFRTLQGKTANSNC